MKCFGDAAVFVTAADGGVRFLFCLFCKMDIMIGGYCRAIEKLPCNAFLAGVPGWFSKTFNFMMNLILPINDPKTKKQSREIPALFENSNFIIFLLTIDD